MKPKMKLSKLMAVILAAAMVLGSMPATVGADVDIPYILSAPCTYNHNEIIRFEPLAYYIAEQTVPQGTELWELNLPPVLVAMVHIASIAATPTDMATPTDAPTATEMYVPVTWEAWPEFDGDMPGLYVFTALVGGGFIYADALPVILVTVDVAVNTMKVTPLSTGTFNLATGTGTGTGWTWTNPVLTINNGANVTITGSVSNGRRIAVSANATATITLDNVSISTWNFERSPILLNNGATLTLNLAGENSLTAANMSAGIQVSSGTRLNIRGTGSLTVLAHGSGAGIGGSSVNDGTGSGGIIDIGGSVNVTARGSFGHFFGGAITGGAGIGGAGGTPYVDGGDGGIIVIGGDAFVYARGGYNSAGIGGGASASAGSAGGGNGGNITIRDNAQVTATGGGGSSTDGAGIGGSGGRHIPIPNGGGNGGVITIQDNAYVIATGGGSTNQGFRGGAGIGGGTFGNGGNINIWGGTVVATGVGGSAAIGGGSVAGTSGSGVGSRIGGAGGNIIISGSSTVTALAGNSAMMPYCIGSSTNSPENRSGNGFVVIQHNPSITAFTVEGYSISSTPVDLNFGVHQSGYPQLPEREVTITNTGVHTLTMRELPTVHNWTLTESVNWRVPFAPGQTRTFTIRPNNNLFAGVHSPVIYIEVSHQAFTAVPRGMSIWIRPRFEVVASRSISAYPDAPNFGSHQVGYAQISEQTITVTNTGNDSTRLMALPEVENWTLTPSADWLSGSMQPGESWTFTLRPNIGLSAGMYSPTITITCFWNTSTTIQPTFTVTIPVIATGLVGTVGGDTRAPWRLYGNGTLVVDSGFIHWNNVSNSPWSSFREIINRIIFTGPIEAGTHLRGLFVNLQYVTAIEGLYHFNTSNVTSMAQMFRGTSSLISLDLSNFDTSRVTSMFYMFFWANSLTDLNLSGFDTSNVTNMYGMFSTTHNLHSLDLSCFDTQNVTDMGMMFENTGLINLNLSNFDTRSVTSMAGMFSGARSLESLDLSDWNTGNVTNMGGMFRDTRTLVNLDLSSFDTSNVRSMHYMFSGASGLSKLDLSNFDTTSVLHMHDMFTGTTSLQQITFGFTPGINANMPPVPYSDTFTGRWRNVDVGTIDNPRGNHILTSAELMTNNPMLDTWVWQPQRVSDSVTEITVLPNIVQIKAGDTRQFTANVTVTGNASTAVTWSVIGNYAADTTINADGLLNVAENETAASLIVRATSTFDTLVYGTATVTVTTPTLTVGPTSWAVPYAGGNTTVSVTSNVSWTVSRGAYAWLTVSPESGSNSGSFTITAAANTDTAQRSGAITITGNGISRTITVTQPPQPTVTDVIVTPTTATVQRGATQQFEAIVEGENSPPQTVTWEVTGNIASGTAINAAGLLTVAEGETAENLTIKATSTHDTDVYGIADVIILIVLGDANRDGRVTSADGTRLARHLAGHGVAIELRAMDLDGNGYVEGYDLVLLVNWLMGHGAPPVVERQGTH